MSGGHSTYTPKTGIERWFDARMPLPRLVYDSFVAYPVPRNLNYAYTFGGILSIMLVVQILTGIVLAMHYAADTRARFRFGRKDHARREFRLAAALYARQRRVVLLHRRLHPHLPRPLLRLLQGAARAALDPRLHHLPPDDGDRLHGLRAALGPDVRLGRHRHHRLLHAIPLVGDWIQQLLLGGFAVDNPTLNRFFSLHYLLPFMIAGVVVLHVWALHVVGQTNPTGIEVKSKTDTVPFTPYATIKDAFGMIVFLVDLRLFRLLHAELSRPSGQLHASSIR